MKSLFDELCDKVGTNPKLTKRSAARFDLGLLLFNSREDLAILWKKADLYTKEPNNINLQALEDITDKLRPIFGERES